MKKRVLSLFLALTLCLTLLPTAALATEDEMSAQSAEALLSTEGAAGTAEDPILIGSLSELEAFRYRVNEYRERTLCAQLTADITLGDNWTSIGNNLAYNGTFDGNGHTIKAENGVQNLFGRLGNAGKVQGLTVEIYTMTAPSGSGVIAQENQGTIEALGWLAVALVIFATWKSLRAIWGSYLFGVLYWAYNYIPGLSRSTLELFKMLPYVVTILVLLMVSMRKKKEDQPPQSLGIPYFREER